MSSQWTSNTLPSGNLRPAPEDLDKFVVLLLYGKNSFGDKIYSYLKITIGGIDRLKDALIAGRPFNPSDFGTVIAAGRGEPTDEVRAEVASTYQVINPQSPAKPAAGPLPKGKKGWDEY